MRRLFAALSLLLIAPAVRAQEPFWQPAGGPPGARIEHVAYDAASGVTLAASSTGVFRLAAGGMVWEPVFITTEQITDLHLHPSGAVFVSTLSVVDPHAFRQEVYGTVWRSADQGDTWDQTSVIEQPGPVVVGTDPSGVLFAGCGTLYRSHDAGLTWDATPQPRYCPEELAFSPTGKIYAMNHSFDGAVSSDGGATWTQIVGYSDTGLLAFATDSAGWIYASLQNWETSWYVSVTDTLPDQYGQMAEWDVSTSVSPFPTTTLAPSPDGHMLAGTYGDGVYKSMDRGVSWLPLGLSGHYVLSLAAGPDNLILAGTSEGVYRATDDGATWALLRDGLSQADVAALLPQHDGAVLAGTEGGGLFRYTPSGEWEPLSSPEPFVHVLHRTAGGTLFAGTEDGLYRTTNGVFWDTLRFPHSVGDASDLSIRTLAETPDGVLFAGAFEIYDALFGEIYRSTDGGHSWHRTGFVQIPFRMPTLYSQLIATADGTVLNVGNGIYRFDPSDTTWTDLAPNEFGRFTTAARLPDGSVLVGAQTALLRLDADGTTWHPASDEIKNAAALAVNDEGHLFAATEEGVFRSTDGGASWEDVSGGLGGAPVQVLALDEEGVLWAGTEARGVYRSVVSTITAWEEQPRRPASRVAGFPNPFAGVATIRAVLDHAGPVRLTVYDVRGREVARLINEWRPAGTFEVGFDGRRLAPGVYFYTLEAGGQRLTRPIVLAR